MPSNEPAFSAQPALSLTYVRAGSRPAQLCGSPFNRFALSGQRAYSGFVSFRHFAIFGLVLSLGGNLSFADRVETTNGDQFAGKVLTLDTNTLTLQNENLGIVKLPRSKVTVITLEPAGATNTLARAGSSNSAAAISPRLETNNPFAFFNKLGVTSNLVAQIQKQYLASAPPEARDTFNELMAGLLSGKLTVADIRAQAKSMADQVRAVRKDLGEEEGEMVDAYLSILDRFLNSTGKTGE